MFVVNQAINTIKILNIFNIGITTINLLSCVSFADFCSKIEAIQFPVINLNNNGTLLAKNYKDAAALFKEYLKSYYIGQIYLIDGNTNDVYVFFKNIRN